jgi:glycosyltransferase involved in cell wall biosynthesis
MSSLHKGRWHGRRDLETTMRLMFVITRGDILGGAQSYVRDLARRFHEDGDDVLVVCGAKGEMTDALAASGIEVAQAPGLLREIHPVHDVRSTASMARLIRSYRPDVVTSHSSKAGIVARLAAQIAGVPCLFTVHGWAFNPSEPVAKRTMYQVLERVMAPLATQIICVSQESLQRGTANGIGKKRMVAIHNGIPDVLPSMRATPGSGDIGSVKVISVARFAPPKDHETLLRAVQRIPGVRLDLIGDGPAEAGARQLTAALGIGDRVRFLGNRRDVAALLADSQVFALCSRSEGFPISTLEAMRAGLPVLVSNVGGAPEAVVDGETGFVVADNSVTGWSDGLARLVGDSAMRSRLGEAGRARYEALFTFDQMYAQVASAYRSAARAAISRGRVAESGLSGTARS